MRDKLSKLLYKKKTHSFMAFIIPALLSLFILISNRVFPFGTNCILHVDMYHQYCPFFTEFLDKLRNGGSLMYSWNIGLGSDFISVYTYYLASPLNWLIILFPHKYVIEFMTILIVVKISFSGYAMFAYIREHFMLYDEEENFDKNQVLLAQVFGLAYAFCGFVAAYSWDIMWMDCIALAPLIFLGFEKLYKENKVVLYFVTLSISILANYYISIMICLFLVFYFIYYFFTQKEGRWKALGRFSLYSILAGGTGVVLMLPEMKILSYSGSSGMSFPSMMEWYFSIIEELSRMCTLADVYTSVNHWPNLYTGAFSFILVVLYALNKKISIKEKLPKLLMLAFFIVSFSNNWLDFIWHGLHFPDQLPGRQAFLFSFLLLVLGYETLIKHKGTSLWHIGAAFFLSLGILGFGIILTDHDITSEKAFLVTGILVGVYAVSFLLFKIASKTSREAMVELICTIMIAELFVNMVYTGFYTTDRVDYTKNYDAYDELIELANEDAMKEEGVDSSDEVFFRFEDTERKTKNDDSLYGYKSTTQFSSLMNINVSHFFQKQYMEGGKNFYSFNGATPLTAAMLSVKYQLFDNDKSESELRTLVGKSGSKYLYRNNYCLPLGYVIDESVVEDYEATTFDEVLAINYWAKLLGATENLLEEAGATVEKNAGSSNITVYNDGYYYANYVNCDSDSLTVSSEDGRSTGWSKTTHEYMFDLGQYNSGDVITISNNNAETIDFKVYKLNMDAVKTAYETLNEQTFMLEKYSDTSVVGSVDVSKAGRLVFSIPNEEGWSLYVDGKKQDIQYFDETFISVFLGEGNHQIELKYATPGLLEGALVSSGCICVFLICLYCRKRFFAPKVEETDEEAD